VFCLRFIIYNNDELVRVGQRIDNHRFQPYRPQDARTDQILLLLHLLPQDTGPPHRHTPTSKTMAHAATGLQVEGGEELELRQAGQREIGAYVFCGSGERT